MEILETGIILIITIAINSLSYYYLLDKHKTDKKKKGDYSRIKSITMYGISSLVYIMFIVGAYLVNLLALDMMNIYLMVIFVIISYLLAIVISFVHSNMTVEFIKYLIREETSDKRILVLIIHNILVLGVMYISLHAFIPLVDFKITNILRILMLCSFILSFTIVIIYKEIKYNKVKQ